MNQAPWSSYPAPQRPDTAAGWSWKIRHSAWLLAPLLGIGVLSFVGFAYCAIRIRTTRWVVLAAVAVLASVVAWVVAASWTTPAGDLTNGAAAYVIGLWLSSVAFGLIVAPDYLHWRAGHDAAPSAR